MTKPFQLNEADLRMAYEMFTASPDGQAEEQRIAELIQALPDAQVEIIGVNLDEDDQ